MILSIFTCFFYIFICVSILLYFHEPITFFDFSTRPEHTWERLRSTSPDTPPIKITRLTFPLSSSPSSAPLPSANVKKISHQNHRTRNYAMDGMDNKPVLNDDPSVTLTIRLIMQGKVSHTFITAQ